MCSGVRVCVSESARACVCFDPLPHTHKTKPLPPTGRAAQRAHQLPRRPALLHRLPVVRGQPRLPVRVSCAVCSVLCAVCGTVRSVTPSKPHAHTNKHTHNQHTNPNSAACCDLAAGTLDVGRFQRSVLRRGVLLKRGKSALFQERYAVRAARARARLLFGGLFALRLCVVCVCVRLRAPHARLPRRRRLNTSTPLQRHPHFAPHKRS